MQLLVQPYVKETKISGQVSVIALHEDETSAQKVLEECQNTQHCLQVKQKGQRTITFLDNEVELRVDPNRIFTDAGIREQLGEKWNEMRHTEIKQFASQIVEKLKHKKVVISLHNNKGEEYTIESYRKELSSHAKNVFINSKNDPANFFYVTYEQDFTYLSKKGYNCVLQANDVKDDGSLSVWAAKNVQRYINVETRRGQVKEQREMVKLLYQGNIFQDSFA